VFSLVALVSFQPSHRLALLPTTWKAPALPPPPNYDNPDLPLLPLDVYGSAFPSLTLPPVFPPSLAERLVSLLLRPIESHEEAAEKMRQHCPLYLADKIVNPDQFRGEADFWRQLDKDEIVARRVEMVKFLEEKLGQGKEVVGHESMPGGRGIVLTGGNQDTTQRMITLMKHLRRLNVELPIEIFHFKGELTNNDDRREISRLGGTIREISGVEKVAGVWKNFQIKGLAIVESSFREVLYLDSDNIPLRNPSHLFDAPLYLTSGRAIFFPDLSKDHPDNAIWRLIGDRCTLDDWTFESGQIVIDKAGNDGLNLAALWIASYMMGDLGFWFKMCGGDKDTFRWAFRALDLQMGHSPKWMSPVGFLNGYEGGRFCGHTMLQYDLVIPEGYEDTPPLFVHSNLVKHLGAAGLSKGKLYTHVKRPSMNDYTEPTLNHAHLYVYTGNSRGMCTDLDWHDDARGMTDEEKSVQYIETIELGELEGDPFAGFEDAWWDEGGRVGGW
ncbi:alpha 1,2-mannosyltransferase, partial [Tremellales sp. Uapishka_1]